MLKEQNQNKARPWIDIYSNQSEYILIADMPRVNKNSLEIKAENGYLEISSNKLQEDENLKALYLESKHLGYYRKIKLDSKVDLNAISAKIEEGVLEVRLPLSAESKPRQIVIN